MTLDSAFLIAFLAAFLRTSAMTLASPLFAGASIPIMLRVFFSALLAVAIAPLLQGSIAVPENLPGLLSLALTEVGAGLFLGFCSHMILLSAQMAGALLDIQVGFSMASVMAPNNSAPVTLLARFKMLLALLLFVTLNGHHMLVASLVGSYNATHVLTIDASLQHLLGILGSMSLLAVQIALPVAAVSLVVDACMGIVARAVPQINVLMSGISAKLLLGMAALSFALPATALAVQKGLDITGTMLQSAFR